MQSPTTNEPCLSATDPNPNAFPGLFYSGNIRPTRKQRFRIQLSTLWRYLQILTTRIEMRIRGYIHFEVAIATGLQFEIIFRCLGQSNQAFYFKHRSTNLSILGNRNVEIYEKIENDKKLFI